MRLTLGGRPYEVFVGLFLDSQNRVLASEELFRGTLAQTSVYPREVVKAALARNAAAMIFAHNHPSGVAEPSRADEMLTQALKQALALVDIRTLDHFVVAGGRLTLFAERGLLRFVFTMCCTACESTNVLRRSDCERCLRASPRHFALISTRGAVQMHDGCARGARGIDGIVVADKRDGARKLGTGANSARQETIRMTRQGWVHGERVEVEAMA